MKVSPWLAFGIVAFLCVFGVCWGCYKADPEDTEWNDADIPPPQAPVAFGPEFAMKGSSDPMRHRRYAPSLFEASASIIGTF